MAGAVVAVEFVRLAVLLEFGLVAGAVGGDASDVSLYLLELHPGTELARAVAAGELTLPPDAETERYLRDEAGVADTIDLHHMDVATAKTVLLDFIEHSLKRRRSCVRIVHGKGLRSRHLPRLKLMTGRVLRKHPRVIAFASCRPIDGGTGATNVLLKARQETGK